MKRVVFWAILVAAGLVITTQTSLMTDIFLLLVMGIVPGTNLHAPAFLMLIGYPLIAIAAIYWLVKQPMFIGNKQHNEKLARQIARKKVMKISRSSSKQQKITSTRRRYKPIETT